MMGSGTSIDAAKEMGIEALGLDLPSGFNISAIRSSGGPTERPAFVSAIRRTAGWSLILAVYGEGHTQTTVALR
jgi:hypothetical protein